MNPLNRRIIDQWHHVAQSGDFADLDTMIHDDAVFESPIIHTPQRGKAIAGIAQRLLRTSGTS